MMIKSHRIAVYVPSKIRDAAVPALHRKYVKKVLTALGRMFGGSTMIKAVGTWMDDRGELVRERVGICYSFVDGPTLAAFRSKVFDLAREVASGMSQDAVAVEMDGGMHLVEVENLAAMAV